MAEEHLKSSNVDSRITLNDQYEVQSILGKPPGWLLYWGITAIFLVVILFGTLFTIIKYPDIIDAQVIITTENPSIRVVARVDGKLEQLLVEDKEKVVEGQILGVLENPADYLHILQLEDMLLQYGNSQVKELQNIVSQDWVLGNLQPIFGSLRQNLEELSYIRSQQSVYQKIKNLRQQQEQLRQLNESLELQRKNLEEELILAESANRRIKEDYKVGGITLDEVEASDARVLQYKRQIESLRSQIYNNQIRVDQLDVEIIDLRQGRSDQEEMETRAITEDRQRLLSAITSWKQDYLLTAPIDGRASLAQIWSPKQFVNANQEILTIVPGEKRGAIVGKAYLPIERSGKVEEGMSVNIRLDAYPFQEYGVVEGKVAAISLVPEGDAYSLRIALPEGIKTTDQTKEIPFRQELHGTARIITKDRTILERIFSKLSALQESF